MSVAPMELATAIAAFGARLPEAQNVMPAPIAVPEAAYLAGPTENALVNAVGWLPWRQRNAGVRAVIREVPLLLGSLSAFNNSGATVYLALFDSAQIGNVVLGTTEPVFEWQISGGAQLLPPLPPDGMAFFFGLVLAVTTASMGTAAAAAGVHVYGAYKGVPDNNQAARGQVLGYGGGR